MQSGRNCHEHWRPQRELKTQILKSTLAPCPLLSRWDTRKTPEAQQLSAGDFQMKGEHREERALGGQGSVPEAWALKPAPSPMSGMTLGQSHPLCGLCSATG